MKVGIIGAGTMGQGIAKAFAMVDGYEVALCDIKQEWAEGGKDKIAKGYARLVEKEKTESDDKSHHLDTARLDCCIDGQEHQEQHPEESAGEQQRLVTVESEQ